MRVICIIFLFVYIIFSLNSGIVYGQDNSVRILSYYPIPYGAYTDLDSSGQVWIGEVSVSGRQLPLHTQGGSGMLQVGGTTSLETAVFGYNMSGYGIVGCSNSANAVYGYSMGRYGYGIYGYSADGSGINGESRSCYGIKGFSRRLYGVWGDSVDGIGVKGESDYGRGIYGMSGNGNGVFLGRTREGPVVEAHGVNRASAVYGRSESAAAISAFSRFGKAISAYSSAGEGIYCSSNYNHGLCAESFRSSNSENTNAVLGTSAVDIGVYGSSGLGRGVYGKNEYIRSHPVSPSALSLAGVYGKGLRSPGITAKSESGGAVYAETGRPLRTPYASTNAFGLFCVSETTYWSPVLTIESTEFPALLGASSEKPGIEVTVRNSSSNAIVAAGRYGRIGLKQALPFTGSHIALLSPTAKNIERGMLVICNGKLIKDDKSIDSVLPEIELACGEMDERIFGVYNCEENIDENFWYKPKEGDKFCLIDALGDGVAWVTDKNGPVKNGDFITTSSIPGYGQRQDDSKKYSYTLGKAVGYIDWEKVTDTVEYNGRKYKKCLIAVIYQSG